MAVTAPILSTSLELYFMVDIREQFCRGRSEIDSK